MQSPIRPVAEAYDLIAENYDVQWSAHVLEPQRRLTHELRLLRGERCADLGCGTGVDTIEMARRVTPGEVVGVDCSQGMLDAAQRRATASGLALKTSCQTAEAFIAQCDDASFDAISVRFCLGYLDWRTVLARMPRLLRANGRLGILTILADSARQAYDTYESMAHDLGVPTVSVTALQTLEQLEEAVSDSRLMLRRSWLHDFELTFASGADLAGWLRTSGIATAPQLSDLPLEVLDTLWSEFARRIELERGGSGVSLQFRIAGVIAERGSRR